jgi:hypothetical protein
MTWGGAIRASLAAFAAPAILVGAAIGNSPWQLVAGIVGVGVWLVLNAQGIETRQGEDPQELRAEHESPVPQGCAQTPEDQS